MQSKNSQDASIHEVFATELVPRSDVSAVEFKYNQVLRFILKLACAEGARQVVKVEVDAMQVVKVEVDELCLVRDGLVQEPVVT